MFKPKKPVLIIVINFQFFMKHEKNYRNEIKYICPRQDIEKVYFQLNKLNFERIYEPRIINNIYFDDYTLSSFYTNEDGISKREKIRVRWYNKEKKYTLEIKKKKEFLNTKVSLSLSNGVSLNNRDYKSFGEKLFESIKKKNSNFFYKNNLDLKIPTLYNNYYREYFYNQNLDIRITLDKNLNFTSPITNLTASTNDNVMEVKYDEKNQLKRIPLNIGEKSKFSKYAKGLILTTSITKIY